MRTLLFLFLTLVSASALADFTSQKIVVVIDERFYIASAFNNNTSTSTSNIDGFGYNENGELIFCITGVVTKNKCMVKDVAHPSYTIQQYVDYHAKINNIKYPLVAQGYAFIFSGDSSNRVSGLEIGYYIKNKE